MYRRSSYSSILSARIKRHHIREKNSFEAVRHRIESSNNALSRVPSRAPREPRVPVDHRPGFVRDRRVDTRAFGDRCQIDEAPWPGNRLGVTIFSTALWPKSSVRPKAHSAAEAAAGEPDA